MTTGMESAGKTSRFARSGSDDHACSQATSGYDLRDRFLAALGMTFRWGCIGKTSRFARSGSDDHACSQATSGYDLRDRFLAALGMTTGMESAGKTSRFVRSGSGPMSRHPRYRKEVISLRDDLFL